MTKQALWELVTVTQMGTRGTEHLVGPPTRPGGEQGPGASSRPNSTYLPGPGQPEGRL